MLSGNAVMCSSGLSPMLTFGNSLDIMYEGQTGGTGVGFSVGAEIPSLVRGTTTLRTPNLLTSGNGGFFEVKALEH